ncbi:hypothetical protein F4604DRAFT_1689480 [Suillus subluteus]|nr:hypothetical protein F4604DRAFT_1689480 [Suillus subluteus]
MNSFIQDSAIDLSLDLQQHYAHLLVFPQCYDSFIPAPHLPISALLDFTNLPPFDHSLTAFALCKAGEDDKSNLSFKSLTSIDTLRDLRDLPRTDPDMWQRIQLCSTTTRINDDSVDAEVSLPEDDVVESDGVDDEAPLEVVLKHIMSDKTYVPEGYIMGTDGSLIVDSAADKHCDMISPSDSEGIEEAGRGKRQRIANTQYGEYDAH